jgi:flagellar biosynthesis GTPase FlhF
MTDISEIDKQINEARAAKDEMQNDGTQVDSQPRRRPRLTKEEREERDRLLAEQKAEKKAQREEARLARKAKQAANKLPPHMKKIQKIFDALPELSERTKEQFELLESSFSLSEIEALIPHLECHVRMERTTLALSRTVEEGQTVRIISGPTKFIGKVGTIVKSQRIRCYVKVPGHSKDVYLFISDTQDCAEGTLVEETPDDCSDASNVAV